MSGRGLRFCVLLHEAIPVPVQSYQYYKQKNETLFSRISEKYRMQIPVLNRNEMVRLCACINALPLPV